MPGYKRIATVCSDGEVVGGGLQPIINITKEKMNFYRTLKLDKNTMKCIKFLNEMQRGL